MSGGSEWVSGSGAIPKGIDFVASPTIGGVLEAVGVSISPTMDDVSTDLVISRRMFGPRAVNYVWWGARL